MEQYLQDRERQKKKSRVTGITLTVSMHIVLGTGCSLAGLTYLDPPPPEQEQILIEFEDIEISKPKQVLDGTNPRAEVPDPTEDINLVQRSEALHEGSKSNEAREAEVDDFGDVETQEAKREKEINRKALYSAANNNTKKDTLAPQTSREPDNEQKAGHAQGNTRTGETSGEPNAKLTGRSVNGTLPRPSYPVQESGIVVVDIWVDNYGTVQKAIVGEGTTCPPALWQAARKAALGAHFNMSSEAPALQKGTITYIFKLD